jgi:predicted nucleotidyltransferase
MQLQRPKTTEEYAANRSRLLESIVQFLKEDQRFVAAWLTGSYARNEADHLSDLDLTVIVDNASAKELCARPHQVWAGTNAERYTLFCQFGEPHIIHENNNNAPPGSSFTCVIYKETALVVDWTLRPDADITRPASSVLLFDKAGIRVEPPVPVEDLSERVERASEQVAFFWMMVMVTVKYLIRRDEVSFHELLNMLHGILSRVRRLVAGEPERWHRGSYAKLATTHEAQLAAVRQACQEMLDLMPDVMKMGGTVPDAPMSTIEVLIQLAEGQS